MEKAFAGSTAEAGRAGPRLELGENVISGRQGGGMAEAWRRQGGGRAGGPEAGIIRNVIPESSGDGRMLRNTKDLEALRI